MLREQPARRVEPASVGEVAVDNQFAFQTGGSHSVAKSRFTLASRANVVLATDEANPLVSQADQVLRHLTRGRVMVDIDRRQAGMLASAGGCQRASLAG